MAELDNIKADILDLKSKFVNLEHSQKAMLNWMIEKEQFKQDIKELEDKSKKLEQQKKYLEEQIKWFKEEKASLKKEEIKDVATKTKKSKK